MVLQVRNHTYRTACPGSAAWITKYGLVDVYNAPGIPAVKSPKTIFQCLVQPHAFPGHMEQLFFRLAYITHLHWPVSKPELGVIAMLITDRRQAMAAPCVCLTLAVLHRAHHDGPPSSSEYLDEAVLLDRVQFREHLARELVILKAEHHVFKWADFHHLSPFLMLHETATLMADCSSVARSQDAVTFSGRTTSSGSFVAPRTRSVTLPMTQRSSPPRPCVDMAIKSQPVNPSAPPSCSSCSAVLVMASAASASSAIDHVIERFRPLSVSCKRPSLPSGRLLHAPPPLR